MVGRVGADAFGEAVRAQLVTEGVDVSFLTTDPEEGNWDSTHRCRLRGAELHNHRAPGQPHALIGEHVARGRGAHRRRVGAARPARGTSRGRTSRARAGSPSRDDDDTQPGARRSSWSDELLSLVDICVPNEVEAAAARATAAWTTPGCPHGRRGAARHGCTSVVVTLGGKGARSTRTVKGRSRCRRCRSRSSTRSPPETPSAAGSASALAEGADLASALGRATAAGALGGRRSRSDAVIAGRAGSRRAPLSTRAGRARGICPTCE